MIDYGLNKELSDSDLVYTTIDQLVNSDYCEPIVWTRQTSAVSDLVRLGQSQLVIKCFKLTQKLSTQYKNVSLFDSWLKSWSHLHFKRHKLIIFDLCGLDVEKNQSKLEPILIWATERRIGTISHCSALILTSPRQFGKLTDLPGFGQFLRSCRYGKLSLEGEKSAK